MQKDAALKLMGFDEKTTNSLWPKVRTYMYVHVLKKVLNGIKKICTSSVIVYHRNV